MEVVIEFQNPVMARKFGDALVGTALKRGLLLQEQIARPLSRTERRTIQLQRGKIELDVDPEARFPEELL